MPDPGRPGMVAVTVVRSGGIAGLQRRWQADAGPDAAPRWIALIDQCPWDDPPERPTGADQFMWRIDVSWDRPDRTVDLPDEAVTGPWQTLVDEVQSAAEAQAP